jgi:hypothetical protein
MFEERPPERIVALRPFLVKGALLTIVAWQASGNVRGSSIEGEGFAVLENATFVELCDDYAMIDREIVRMIEEV